MSNQRKKVLVHQRKNGNVSETVARAEHYQGPIPHPELLKQLEAVIPGGADRVLTMAESQAAHRQYLEKAKIGSDLRTQARAQGFAFMITMVTIVFSFVLILLDKPVAGFSTLIGTALTAGSIWGVSKFVQKKELHEKAEEVDKYLPKNRDN